MIFLKIQLFNINDFLFFVLKYYFLKIFFNF